MNPFKIAQPGNTGQLSGLLAEISDRSFLIAGGTDLLDEIKQEIIAPDILIDLGRIPELSAIEETADGLRIGAMATVSSLADFPAVGRLFPGLRQAALSLASPQLRNVGTVGGNLCQRPRCWYYRDGSVLCRKKGGSRCYAVNGRNKYHAILGGGLCYIVHPSDLAPMLMALGASVTITGPDGDRTLSLEDFYQPPRVDVKRENILDRNQFLSSVFVPKPKNGALSTYLKLKERGTWDFALVSAALCGEKTGDTMKNLHIVLGGVAPIPWRLKKSEKSLEGRPLSSENIRSAAGEELKDARTLKDNGYKMDLVKAVLEDAILSLM
jgi:xanthine dehydrogenase YagS FAD-binding subunit